MNVASVSANSQKLFDSRYGLSNSLINGICQDSVGFIWIATEDGLNRFDGKSFRTYSTQSEPTLNANFVTSVFADSNGTLWLGTINALQKYIPQTDKFENIKLFDEEQIAAPPYISDIVETKQNTLWIATTSYGIIQYDTNAQSAIILDNLNNQLCSKNIKKLFVDSEENIWIGTVVCGLYCFNQKTLELTHLSQFPNIDILSIAECGAYIYFTGLTGGVFAFNKDDNTIVKIHADNPIAAKTVFVDSQKRIFIGSDGGGLYQIDNETNSITKTNYQNTSFDFNKSKIHSILEDKSGNIWLAIFQKGLFLLDESTSIFKNYGYNTTNPMLNIGSSCVTAIAETDRFIWLGTDGDGLYKIDKEDNSNQHVSLEKIGGSNILSLFHDGEYLWIGSYLDGLVRYDIKDDRAQKFNAQNFNIEKITSIEKLGNSLLLGTLGNRICRFNISTSAFDRNLFLSNKSNDQIPQYINDIHIDKSGNIWLASYDGLIRIALQNEEVSTFTTANSVLQNNLIYAIHEDENGDIWAGTYGGLTNISQQRSYSTNDGLGSNVICSVLSDKQNTLWVSTHNGISYRTENSDVFSTFFHHDGIQANEFYKNAALCAADGSIYFGGINGATQVSRAFKDYQPQLSEVVLTELYLFNNTQRADGKNAKAITLADTITFNEGASAFSISFASNSIANQSKINYQYMLDGFDEDWIQSKNDINTATYTNLNHGKYTFKVKAQYKNNKSAERQLTIIILPPWYKTIAANVLWLVLFISISLVIYYSQKERIRRKEIERSDERKMQFFINVSHEIKTPLSLIIDPLNKLISQRKNENDNRLYQIMYSNANRILRLTNQILDIRKIEKGLLRLHVQKTRVCELVNELSMPYFAYFSSKNIQFQINCSDTDIVAWIDVENFEKVIFNVLSNAVKHTPENGKITIEIQRNEKLCISIFNSGECIPENELEKIFSRFYQTENSNKVSGTGIGLDLARSLIEMHQGSIKARNAEDASGVFFLIELLLGNAHFEKEDIAGESVQLPLRNVSNVVPLANSERSKPEAVNHQNKILIIDDDKEITNYLKYELQDNYTVLSFQDSQKAIQEIRSFAPSVVICDVMMPHVDGFELCSLLKNDITTSHIPVILLSASNNDEFREKGTAHGADLYLTKPFNTKTLKKSIENLLENRRRVYQNVMSHTAGNVDYSILNLNSQDETLLKKIEDYIIRNISSSELTVDSMASEVGMSRVHLYRKLKEMTNLSASDYIKSIKMKYAAEILRNKKVPISEVAYKLGYSSPAYFSKSFKSFYGISPKDFAQMG
ncbi:MAG: two-component regulator propeller domain-containing protein [Mangrovibacterium sp.]